MQFTDRLLAAVVSTSRLLKWTQALGMVVASFLVLPTAAQNISGTFQSQSIVINIATGPNNLAVGFTTPSSTAGGNPQLPLNGEFDYYPGNINLYQSYWLMYQGNQLADLGLVGIGGSSLLPDSDANGIPNFAERSLEANVSASLVTVSAVTGGTAGATIILTRSAGQTSGSSVTRFTTGAIFTGSWVIPILDVAGSYNASQRTIHTRATSSFFSPGDFSGTYQVNSEDSVTMSNIILQLDSGNRLTSTPVTYTRFGSTYRAIIEFVDGNLSTGYPDFRRWTLQFTDPADNDGDGIPNLSDSTPYGSPPVVVTQPIGATRTVGQSVTFSIAASGSGSLSYQWYLNGNPIAGANASSYTLPTVALVDAGSYTAGVSNSAGSVTSTPAALTVTPVVILPSISGQPQSLAINQGQSAEFTVTATGSSLGYQWFKDGQNITGATASVLRITSTQISDGGVYRVVVSNSAGSETSSPALLSVNSPPIFIDLQPTAVGEESNLSIQLKTADSEVPSQNLITRLVSGPDGLVVSPQGFVSWAPTEAQGGRSYPVSVEVSDGSLSTTGQFEVTVAEVNRSPVINPVTATAVAEGTAWTQNLTASDPDLPANGLSFRLVSGPSGASVDPKTGVLSWTPSEADGGSTVDFVVEVADDVQPPLASQTTVQLTVTEVNNPPTLEALADVTVPEEAAWSITVRAADSDLPAQPLTYALKANPPGMTLDSSTGELRWKPSESQGPGTFTVTMTATDSGGVTTERSFSVTVADVNQSPALAPVADQSLSEGQTLNLSLSATDVDLPVQPLTYALVSGPAGLTVSSSGVLSWTPTEAQGPTTQVVTVSVTDGVAVVAISFLVTVAEVNQQPQVAAWADQRLVFGQSVNLKMDVTDADLPANRLTYRMVEGLTNLVLSEDGRLIWTPTRSQAPSTNRISVAVSDGTVSATNSVRIEVFELVMAVNGAEATNAVNASLNPRISFRCGRPDWLVFYTLTGQTPTADLPSKFYQDPFFLPATSTVWPIAFSPDFSDSILGLPVRVAVLKGQTLSVEGGLGLIHLGPGALIEGKSDSGLPVTLSVISGPGRLESGRLIPTGGGVIGLRATQAGNDNWAPAQTEFERTVARAAQTVVWQPMDAAVFGGSPLLLRATASSGLPIEYLTLSGPGSVSGDQLQVTGAGEVVLRARQAGNADFDPSTADLAVLVAKAPQTIQWDGLADRSFSREAIPLTGKASSGLNMTYEVLSGPAAISNDRLTVNGVGTVVIRASQAGDTNYQPAPVRQVSFVVSQAAQILAFGPIGSKTFGDGPVTLSATSSVGLPVTYSVVRGPGSLAGNQLSLSGAGEVVIQVSQEGNDLYQAASETLTVTVAKAAQSLSWSPESSLTYSTNLIVLDAKSGSGLLASYRVVSGPGTIVAGQISLTGVGPLVIAAEQSGDANWLAAAAITNRFTVGRGVQVVTFEPVGDQTLGAGPVKLAAQTSSGLPVTFSVINGQAAVNDEQLTLLGAGIVTVRAINPGSPLWLSASADQTFTVRSEETQPQVVIELPKPDGSFSLEIRGPVGVNLILETTSDLSAWTETQRLTGQGPGNPVKLILQPDPNVQAKFWRARIR